MWRVVVACEFSDSLSNAGSQLFTSTTVVEEEEELEEDEQLGSVTTIVSEEVIQEADIAPPPQTDILPWVACTSLNYV